MRYQGFTTAGNFYKGNIHSHTTNSDGHLTPEESVLLFKQNGYHFICFSDHDLYTDFQDGFNTESFIVLPGLEASVSLVGKQGVEKTHHIHGILGTEVMQENAKDGVFKHMESFEALVYHDVWNGQKVVQELVDKLTRRGCITTYNHPIWSKVEASDFLKTQGLWAIEIFNYNTVNESGTGYDTTYWDCMLRKGQQIHAFASDDNHNEGLFDDACGGWICVKAEELTHDAIIKGMLSGNYYSSSGPEIYNWGVCDNEVYIECSPVNRIHFICGNLVNAGTAVMCENKEETMTQATFQLKGNENYVRVECLDQYGKTAWTNALFLKG